MAALAILMAAFVASGSPAAASVPSVERLDGGRFDLSASSAPTILLFWRADCAPCLLELSDLAALRASAGSARVIPVGLQPAAVLRPALARLGLRDGDTLRAAEDPAKVLVRLGGAPPRLPLSVAFRGTGEMCARRSGLLGHDRVRAWSLTCGGGDAGR